MAVRYLAATHGVEVGGDFYDVVPLPGEQVALAVGDVVGHDITAAATMGQLNSVYRALLVDRPAPSAMIDRLQASWSLLGLQRMATALFATLRPGDRAAADRLGRAPAAAAAHRGSRGVPAGARRAGCWAPRRPRRPALEWAGVLPVGATLVLFTDGLVESRVGRHRRGARAAARGRGGGGHVRPRRALRPAAGRPDRRAPRRRHRAAGADPDLA